MAVKSGAFGFRAGDTNPTTPSSTTEIDLFVKSSDATAPTVANSSAYLIDSLGNTSPLVNGVSSFDGRTGAVLSEKYQSLITAASKVYSATTDIGCIYERINGGAAMTDTLPLLAAGDNGWMLHVYNTGTTAAETITFTVSGGGATLPGGATSYVLNFGCRQTFIWTGTKFIFGAGNGNIVKISPGTGSVVAGHFPSFNDTTGRNVGDSTYSAASFDAAGAAAAAQAASQPIDATLTALAAQNWAANALPIGTGADTVGQTAFAVNTFPARASTGNLIAKAISDAGLAFAAAADAAAETALLNAATTALKGLMAALDKQKLDNLYIDVSANPTAIVSAGNTASQNITAINAIMAAAPAGASIFFPGTTILLNAAWTMPAGKQFAFSGIGVAQTGGNSILQWTSNVGGDFITLATNTWYYQFSNLCFTTTVNQTAGAVVNINGNVSTNFTQCSAATAGGFFNHVLYGASGGLNQSWNTAVISNCFLSGYKGAAVYCDSAAASLVVSNTIIQGAWGGTTGAPASLQATAGVQALNCGALQILGSDILGNVNNILLNPGAGAVNASVFCSDTYFDNSGGSCFKITGAGATVRAIFTGCSFTTAGTNYTVAGTAFSAIDIGGSFAFGAGGQSISFTDCNILNTFGTTGTTNGILLSGTWADVYFTGCKVAGWTNGYNVTPSGVNVSNLKVANGACGPCCGYGANTTGFNIAAGSYKGLQIQGVNAHGNGTNLTLGAVTVAAADASLFRIVDNTGINPRGSVTTPGVPTAGTTLTNTTGFRVTVFAINGATAPAAIVVNGVSIAQINKVATTGTNIIALEPGSTIAFTTTTVTSWTWVAN